MPDDISPDEKIILKKLRNAEKNQRWISSLSLTLGSIALLVSLADLLAIQSITDKILNYVSTEVNRDSIYELLKIFFGVIGGLAGGIFAVRLSRKKENMSND